MNAPHVNIAAANETATASQTVAQKVAQYVSGFRYEDIPQATRDRAKLLVLDAVGIALASTQYDFAHRILTGLNALNEGGNASLIGLPGKLALRDAVLMNGVLVHGLDYDDTHIRAIIHATASAFPCALGVAEALDAPGSALLAAYVLGVEMATRVSDAAGGHFHDFGFHPTGLAAHFSCALQAGWLYGLTPRQLVMAQGLAGSTAAGSQEFLEEGAWNKRVHPGWAGVAGITAAQLARAGFKGPTKPYEGRFGLAELLEDTLRDAQILELAAKVECVADPDAAYPQYFSGGLEIHTRDGRTLRHHEKVNRGAGDRALSAADIERKYFENASLAVGTSRAEAICEAVLSLEQRSAADFARLLASA